MNKAIMEYTVEIRLDGELSERQMNYLTDTFENWGPVVGPRDVVFSLTKEKVIDHSKRDRPSPARAVRTVLGKWIALTGDRGDYPEVESIRVIPAPPEEAS